MSGNSYPGFGQYRKEKEIEDKEKLSFYEYLRKASRFCRDIPRAFAVRAGSGRDKSIISFKG